MRLTPQVRASLIAARYGFADIIADQSRTHGETYLCLVGFLWDLHQKAQEENPAAVFTHTLAKLVAKTHIEQDGNLPEPFQTSKSARVWFEQVKQEHPKFLNIADFQLPQVEEEICQSNIALIKKSVTANPSNLELHVLNAIDLIEADIESKKKKQEAVDYPFYEKATRILNNVISNPSDQKAIKRLGDLSSRAIGHRSIGKLVLGGLLMVLGAALIAASIVGFMTTFGSSSVLSAAGIYLGLSLMHTQLALGIASSVGIVSGVVITFFAGKQIKDGLRQGLSQQFADIKKEITTIEQEPREFDGPEM